MCAHLSVIIKHVSTISLLKMSDLSPWPLDTLIHCLLRVLLSNPELCLLSLLAYIIRSSMHPMIRFIPPTRISLTLRSELFLSLFFDVDKKGEKKLEMWIYKNYFDYGLFLFGTLACNNLDIADFGL